MKSRPAFTRMELLAARRQQLISRSSTQRAELARQLNPLAHTSASISTGLRILDRLRRHPEWIVAGAAGLMLLKPRRLSAMLRFASHCLRTWRSLAPHLQMLLRR